MPNSPEVQKNDYRHPDHEITPELAHRLGINPKEPNWRKKAKAILQGDPPPLVLDNRR